LQLKIGQPFLESSSFIDFFVVPYSQAIKPSHSLRLELNLNLSFQIVK